MKDKRKMIVVLLVGVCIGLGIGIAGYWLTKGGGEKKEENKKKEIGIGDGITMSGVPDGEPGKPPEWTDPPVTGKDVDRLPDTRIITNNFVVSGQGYYAKWGRGIKAGFVQRGVFVAEAKVIVCFDSCSGWAVYVVVASKAPLKSNS